MRVVVCLKQVIDPLTPAPALVLDQTAKKIRVGAAAPPVINGFDEQGLEAALQLRDCDKEIEIIGVAVGDRFNKDVMKRSLAVGADQLILVQDPSLDSFDPHPIAAALAAVISTIGDVDLILCGRQGSDWDNALTPFILAQMLGRPVLTLAKKVALVSGRVEIERVLSDGVQTMTAALPALVTVTSELGALRMPSVAARLGAARKQPRQIALSDLSVGVVATRAPAVVALEVPVTGRNCSFIEAADGAAAGIRLAETLLESGAIRPGERPL